LWTEVQAVVVSPLIRWRGQRATAQDLPRPKRVRSQVRLVDARDQRRQGAHGLGGGQAADIEIDLCRQLRVRMPHQFHGHLERRVGQGEAGAEGEAGENALPLLFFRTLYEAG